MFHLLTGIMLFPEEGTLHIDRITVEDQGLYTCEATNERGSVESSAHIWVQSKPLLCPLSQDLRIHFNLYYYYFTSVMFMASVHLIIIIIKK